MVLDDEPDPRIDESSSEWKCGCINADIAGGLSGILTYARIREARRSWVEPPNFNTEYLMP
jgi:hypothetical protein